MKSTIMVDFVDKVFFMFDDMKSDMNKKFSDMNKKLNNFYTKSDMDKKFSEMDKKFSDKFGEMDKKFSDMNENLSRELKAQSHQFELQLSQIANRPSTNTSFAHGLSHAAAIGATPSNFNPSYLR